MSSPPGPLQSRQESPRLHNTCLNQTHHTPSVETMTGWSVETMPHLTSRCTAAVTMFLRRARNSQGPFHQHVIAPQVGQLLSGLLLDLL